MEKTLFRPKQVIKETAWLFASRLKAYQAERRRFYYARRYSPLTHNLPQSIENKVRPFGNIDMETGHITFKKELVSSLEKQSAWVSHPIP